jgi:hypothetical protein
VQLRLAAAGCAALALAACGEPPRDAAPASDSVAAGAAAIDAVAVEAPADIDALATDFVKLALAIGEYDPAFVDAYHGPAEWADAAKAEARPLDALDADARSLIARFDALPENHSGPRAALLRKQAVAAHTRIRMARGEHFTFDEETRLLYDAVAPQYDLAAFDAALAEIEALLPGEGTLATRVEAFRDSLAIPEDRLQTVMDAAIAECRKRTLAHYALPETERFRLQFVTEKPWSGYNWYQGEFESLIEVNTDFPVIIDRAVDLGCHEGYPGHHTWNVFLERDFLNGNGWIEYSIYPLFSPLSLIAEGSANYGIELAFPRDEKIAFERDVLFPLAGLDPARAATLDALNKARRKLSHARNHVAREYLDGRIDRETAIALSMKYSLTSRERAEQGLRFIETYRGYVINYNIGRDLVEAWEKRKATGRTDTWEAFRMLLTTPLSASDMAPAPQ